MPIHDFLYQLAEQQARYFTETQARKPGFSHSLLSFHVGTSRLERVRPRAYRPIQVPVSAHGQLHAALPLAAGVRKRGLRASAEA